VWALRSSPPFDASAMDGIAVRASDTTGARDASPVLPAPEFFEVIDTGDPLPSLVQADALLLIPAGTKGHEADAEVEVQL
jgi:molybdopterin biosynthesis enzyme